MSHDNLAKFFGISEETGVFMLFGILFGAVLFTILVLIYYNIRWICQEKYAKRKNRQLQYISELGTCHF